MIGYIQLEKDNGKLAWIRVDEIAAFTENETRVGAAKDMVPCLTVLLRNNVSWHFPNLTGDKLVRLMRGASGAQFHVLDAAKEA